MLGMSFTKFIFSIINFICLMLVLKKLFFKPVINILEERKSKIAGELAKADEARQEVAKLRESSQEIVIDARREADLLIKKGQKKADELYAQAKQSADKLIMETRESIEREREEVRREMYATLIDLVSFASKKVMYGSISEDYQKELIENSVLQSLKQATFRGMIN